MDEDIVRNLIKEGRGRKVAGDYKGEKSLTAYWTCPGRSSSR